MTSWPRVDRPETGIPRRLRVRSPSGESVRRRCRGNASGTEAAWNRGWLLTRGRQSGGELQHPASALRHRHVDELAAIQLEGVTAGAVEGLDDLARPRELVLGRGERVVHCRQLARV